MEEKFRVVNCDLRDCLKCSYLEIRQRYDVDRMCDYLFCKILQDRIVDLPLEDCPYSSKPSINSHEELFYILKECRCGSEKKYKYKVGDKYYCEDCRPGFAELAYGDIEITFTEPEEDSFGRLMDMVKRGEM